MFNLKLRYVIHAKRVSSCVILGLITSRNVTVMSLMFLEICRSGYEDDHHEERRRLSGIQKQFGGGIKKKAIKFNPKPPEPETSKTYIAPKLRKAPRRPTYERHLNEVSFTSYNSLGGKWKVENFIYLYFFRKI